MARRPPEPQPKKKITYYPPSREKISRFVRTVCSDLEASGEEAVNTEEMRSGLTDILELIAAVCVQDINEQSGQSLDTESGQE